MTDRPHDIHRAGLGRGVGLLESVVARMFGGHVRGCEGLVCYRVLCGDH